MRFFFLDASALAKRYAAEVGTPLVDHLLNNVTHSRMCILNLGIAEVVSILVRKRNAGTISPAAFAQALVDVGSEIGTSSAWRKLIADDALVSAAIPLIVLHSINSTDAVILCAALQLGADARTRGDEVVLVASDHRLLRAAQAEGLTTFNPETQSQADLDALI